MTIGIYRLIFNGTDKTYIGQSVDVARRYKDHLYLLSKGLGAIRLQNAYNKYGSPTIEIIEETTRDKLSDRENYYINKYNSYNNGYNSLEFAEQVPINTASGTEAPAAKYTKEQILEVFYYITDTLYTAEKISELTCVSACIVHYIKLGTGHLWLREIDPIKYDKYIIHREHGNACSNKGISYPKLMSPTGKLINITNRNKFAKENGLDSGALGRVLRGTAKSHKGWRLCLDV